MSSESFFVANHSVAASQIAALAGLSFVTEDFAISAAGTLRRLVLVNSAIWTMPNTLRSRA